jgi:hypothetical protein
MKTEELAKMLNAEEAMGKLIVRHKGKSIVIGRVGQGGYEMTAEGKAIADEIAAVTEAAKQEAAAEKPAKAAAKPVAKVANKPEEK